MRPYAFMSKNLWTERRRGGGGGGVSEQLILLSCYAIRNSDGAIGDDCDVKWGLALRPLLHQAFGVDTTRRNTCLCAGT